MENFGMLCHEKGIPIDVPVIMNHGPSLKDYPKKSPDKAQMVFIPYVSAIKSLMCAMVCIHPGLLLL